MALLELEQVLEIAQHQTNILPRPDLRPDPSYQHYLELGGIFNPEEFAEAQGVWVNSDTKRYQESQIELGVDMLEMGSAWLNPKDKQQVACLFSYLKGVYEPDTGHNNGNLPIDSDELLVQALLIAGKETQAENYRYFMKTDEVNVVNYNKDSVRYEYKDPRQKRHIEEMEKSLEIRSLRRSQRAG